MSPFFDDLEQQLHAAAAQQATRQPAWWRRRRNLAILAVLTVGIATPAVSRVSGVWDPHVAPAPPAPTVTAAAAAPVRACHIPPSDRVVPNGSRIDAGLVAQLAVLRRPQRPSDVAKKLGGGQAVILSSVRYVGNVGGRRYYLAGVVASALHRCGEPLQRTRSTQLCLMERGGSGGCGLRPSDLREHGMVGSSGLSDRRSAVAGVVPDGVIRVTVRYGTSVRSFPVRENFYGYEVAVPVEHSPDVITWTMRDGSHRDLPRGS